MAGTSLLVAPLCIVYRDPADVYSAFRVLYSTILAKVSVVTPCTCPSWDLGGAGALTLPSLLSATESLLFDADPALAWHIQRAGTSVARLTGPWLVSCFVGFLDPAEVLSLWDRIVGCESSTPVALVAVGVLLLRRDALLAVHSPIEMDLTIANIRSLRVSSLLALTLTAGV